MPYTLTAAFSSATYALFNAAKALHNFLTSDNSVSFFVSLKKICFYMRKPLITNISPKSNTFMVQLILQVDMHSF